MTRKSCGRPRRWQLDGWEAGPVEATVAASRAPRDQQGVRIHRAARPDRRDRSMIDGILVTGIALTIVQLASFLRADALATVLDSALVQGLTQRRTGSSAGLGSI